MTGRPVQLALVGAGQRGTHAYGAVALENPSELRFVAVAEPREDRRHRFAEAHGIPISRRYASWEDLLSESRLADGVLIATPDRLHHAPAVAALESGYPTLVEKPMATSVEDLRALVGAARRTGLLLQVCHVLRYSPFFRTLHQVLESGVLGDIVTVSHRENFTFWHMAHSFVRGNWRNEAESSPMILAKACHDLDLLVWNLADPVVTLQSFGSLVHFRPENAPPLAPARCTDGCPASDECPYEATRLYMNESLTGWPVHVITEDLSPAGRRAALEHGPYGRCVYRCDNTVPDQQIVAMQLESGASATLTVQGHSYEEGRTMRYDGTRGTLRARFGAAGDMEIHDHTSGRRTRPAIRTAPGGHGGGDSGVLRAFGAALQGKEGPVATADDLLESHLLALAAEQSRLTGVPVHMTEYRK